MQYQNVIFPVILLVILFFLVFKEYFIASKIQHTECAPFVPQGGMEDSNLHYYEYEYDYEFG